MGGFKTAASANAVFSVIKKKLLAIAGTSPVGTPKKTKAKMEPKPEDDEVIKEGANNGVAATPTGDLDEKTTPPSTPKKGATKPKVDDEEDDDATPTQAMPKKRAPKTKVKTEDDAADQTSFTTPMSTPKKRNRKPKGETPLAPKRAKKANGNSADNVTTKVNEAAENKRMAAAIAASKTLQKFTVGSDDGAEDEPEDEHPGVKELKKIIGARQTAARALEVLDRNADEVSAHGNDEPLAHQDRMFPDQAAMDDELFNRYTPKSTSSNMNNHNATKSI